MFRCICFAYLRIQPIFGAWPTGTSPRGVRPFPGVRTATWAAVFIARECTSLRGQCGKPKQAVRDGNRTRLAGSIVQRLRPLDQGGHLKTKRACACCVTDNYLAQRLIVNCTTDRLKKANSKLSVGQWTRASACFESAYSLPYITALLQCRGSCIFWIQPKKLRLSDGCHWWTQSPWWVSLVTLYSVWRHVLSCIVFMTCRRSHSKLTSIHGQE